MKPAVILRSNAEPALSEAEGKNPCNETQTQTSAPFRRSQKFVILNEVKDLLS
jgi:hypothetical protein